MSYKTIYIGFSLGYPIYVSPLTTSYAGTNNQLTSVLFGEVSLSRVRRVVSSLWRRIRIHCGHTCRNFSSPDVLELQAVPSSQIHTGASSATAGEYNSRHMRRILIHNCKLKIEIQFCCFVRRVTGLL